MGPNSAPNGDRELVDGYSGIESYYCKSCDKSFPSKRQHLVKHKMLYTGKSTGSRK